MNVRKDDDPVRGRRKKVRRDGPTSDEVSRGDQLAPLLAAIVDSSDDAIIGKTLNGMITSWNRGAELMYGYTPDEAIGQHISLITPEDRMDELSDVLASVAQGIRVNHHDTQRVRKDGTVLDISLTVSPIRGHDGNIIGASAIGRNVTDRKTLEREQASLESRRRQSERLESLGELAGGIAHDFNNLLGVILNYTNFVKEELDDPERALDDLEEISGAAQRAASLTRQLLAFARREVLRLEVVDVNDVVAKMEQLLRRVIGEHIELVTYAEDDLWRILADAGQLDQILVNLAINARDAMPEGGLLTIDTGNVEVDAVYAAAHPGIEPGRYVRLRVNDTGEGMSHEVLERAFDPFFTTKPPGQGTGLGLPTVFGIVAQAGGQIQLYSEPGVGTTCRVLLPATDEPVSEPRVATVSVDPRGTETILVVEDQAPLREATRRILKKYGYHVLVSADGNASVELAESYDGPISLLITDVVMPGMFGTEVATRIRAIRPDIKTLFMSGYAQPVLGARLDASITLLEKPYTEMKLMSHVRDALDAP